LIWKWNSPSEKFSEVSTSIRTWVEGFSNGISTGEIYIKVPTHMGWAFAPYNLLQQIDGEDNVIKIGLNVRANDNNSRSYSNIIEWNKANACGCDISGDQKTGLEEAIHALRVVSGLPK